MKMMKNQKMKKIRIANNLRILFILSLLLIFIFISASFFSFYEILYFFLGSTLMFFNILISNLYLGKKLENNKILIIYRNLNNSLVFVSIGLINYKSSKLMVYLLSALLGVIFVRYSYLYLTKTREYYD